MKCIEVALQQGGIPVPHMSRLRACIGPPLRNSFVELGAQPSQVEPMLQAYRDRFREVGMFENVVYPEVPSLLRHLHSAGLRLLVAMSKPTPFAVSILEHFGLAGFFEHVYGSHLDGGLSDKTELVADIHDKTCLVPSKTALVGDRCFDIAAARAHEIHAIGALWGYGSRAELEAAGAHRLVRSPNLVLDALAA